MAGRYQRSTAKPDHWKCRRGWRSGSDGPGRRWTRFTSPLSSLIAHRHLATRSSSATSRAVSTHPPRPSSIKKPAPPLLFIPALSPITQAQSAVLPLSHCLSPVCFSFVRMDKIKDLLHGGQTKDGEHAHRTTTTTTPGGYGEPAYGQTTAPGYAQTTAPGYGQTTPHTEGTGEKKHGLFGMGGHKEGEATGEKKHGFMGMGGGSSSSSSSSDEEREGARDRNRIRREKRAQHKSGVVGGTTVPMEGTGEKKHGFFG